MTNTDIRHIAVEFPEDSRNLWTMPVQSVGPDGRPVEAEINSANRDRSAILGRARFISCIFRAHLHWPRQQRPGPSGTNA